MRNKKFPLFVYGTLKKGYHAHELLKGAKFLGFGYTTKDYKLISLGRYPGLLTCSNGTNNVEGEIYEIDKEIMKLTHSYEGVNVDLFRFDFVSIEEFDLKNKPEGNLTSLMFNRKLCFGYCYNNLERKLYPEIEYFTLD